MIHQKSQNLNQDKAEILGLLCAEGSYYNYVSSYWYFDKCRKKQYFRNDKTIGIDFSNNDSKIQKRFINLLKEVYEYELKVTGIKTARKIKIRKRNVIQDILKYTKIGCDKWIVPYGIINSSKNIRCAFLRGYFLGDGNFYRKKQFIITFVSINKKAINQIQDLLKSLDIESVLYGPYNEKSSKRPIFRLRIIRKKEIFNFIKMIGSNTKFNVGDMPEWLNG